MRAECSHSRSNLGLTFDTNSLNNNSYVESLIRSSVSQYSNIKTVPNANLCRQDFAPVYKLKTKAEEFGDDRILLLEFIDLNMSETVYLKKINFPRNHNTDDAFDIQIHAQISKLLRPYGILTRHAVTQAWADPDYRQSYQCNIDYYDMLRSYSKDEYLKVHTCLKTAIDREKYTLDNLGIMAQIYGSQIYGGMPKVDENAETKMLKILDSVGSNWIKSTEFTIAKIFTEALEEDFSLNNLVNLLYTAENHYGDNAHVGLLFAIHYGFGAGDWEKSLTLYKRHLKIGDEEDSTSYFINLGYSLTQNNQVDFNVCKKAYSQNNTLINLLVNVCAHRVNEQEWINKTEAQLTNMGFADVETRISYIRKLRYEPKISKIMTQTWENMDSKLIVQNTP